MNLRLFLREKIKWRKIVSFEWFKRLYVLYVFGCILNCRPSSPFSYEFLISSKNFSVNEVDRVILPTQLYSASVQLWPVFFLMGFGKYNPLIIIAALTGLVATCLCIWTDSLILAHVTQAFSGSTFAAETAYFVSIYSHSDGKTHQRLTSYVRAAPLVGQLISSLFAQLFISQEWSTYKDLYFFSLAALVVSVIATVFLPSTEETERNEEISSNLWGNLKRSFPNKYVVKWSIWSVLTVCGHNQLSIYTRPFWHHFQKERDMSLYNGLIDGSFALLGLAGTILGGFANFNWKYNGDLLLSVTSLLQAFMLIFISQIESFTLNILFYVTIGFIYNFMVTILCGEIAKFLSQGRFGLVFGLIASVGSALSSGFVVLFNSDVGFQLSYKHLFVMYGFYHLIICVLYIVIGLSYWFAKHSYH